MSAVNTQAINYNLPDLKYYYDAKVKRSCAHNPLHQFLSTTKKLSSCSRCQFTLYCNSACQTADWKRHQKVCDDLKNLNALINSFSSSSDSIKTNNKEKIEQKDQNRPIDRKVEKKSQEKEDRLGVHVAAAMQVIISNAEKSKKNFLADTSLLNQGFWYGQDYANALKEIGTENSLKLYETLRDKGDLLQGRLPSKLFKPQIKNGVRQDFDWVLKPNIKPSEALLEASTGFKGIEKGFAIIECGTAISLARYMGLMNYLKEQNGAEGVEKFDRLFSLPQGSPMNIGYIDTPIQPMRYLINFTEEALAKVKKGTVGSRVIKVGQAVTIRGVGKYKNKHPFSQGPHYNVICIKQEKGNQLFTGLGLPSAGVTENEVCLALANEYNAKPDHFCRIPSEMTLGTIINLAAQNSDQLKTDQVNLENFEREVIGYNTFSSEDFIPDLIAEIVKSPLEKISIAFIEQHPKARKKFEQRTTTGADSGNLLNVLAKKLLL